MYVRKLVLLILGGKSILAVHVVEKSDKSYLSAHYIYTYNF